MGPKNTSIIQAATAQAVSELKRAIKIVRTAGERLDILFPPGSTFHECFECTYSHNGEFQFTRKDGLPIPYVESANGNRLATCFRRVSDCGGTFDITLPNEVVDLVNERMDDSENGLLLCWYRTGGGNVINNDGTPSSHWGGFAHLLMKIQQNIPSH